MIGDVWRVDGNTWYSGRLINKIIELCRKTKEACKDSPAKNLLADDILKILGEGSDK